MKDKAILKKVIEKAKKNGLDNYSIFEDWDINSHASIRGVIFSHLFAKAFFGEQKEQTRFCPKCNYEKEYFRNDPELFCPYDGRKLKEGERIPFNQEWKNHLQEMVLEPKPLKYLEKFI